MKIYLGADHRGFELKEQLKTWFEENHLSAIDLGNDQFDPEDDYPNVAFKVAETVAADSASLGVLICGSGVGVAIAANKVKGIRAGQGWSVDQVEHAKQHDHINILTLASDYLEFSQVTELISIFIDAPVLDEEKFVRRVKKIGEYERGK